MKKYFLILVAVFICIFSFGCCKFHGLYMKMIEVFRQKSPLLKCPLALAVRSAGVARLRCTLLQNLCPLKHNTPLFWHPSSQDRCKNLKQVPKLADRQR